jgi:hypothetical protein
MACFYQSGGKGDERIHIASTAPSLNAYFHAHLRRMFRSDATGYSLTRWPAGMSGAISSVAGKPSIRLSAQRLSPSLGEQFVQGVHDADTFVRQGCHEFAQLLVGNGDNFQRMQDYVNILDLERRIESRAAYFLKR